MARRYLECLGCNAKVLSPSANLRSLLATFPRRWLSRRVARNVAPSLHVGRVVALPRTITIHHGVPAPEEIPRAIPSAEPFCFAYVGRLVWEKGGHVLLRAARKLMDRGYDFRLKIIGDGPYRARLENLTDGLGLRSRTAFTGYLQGEALQDALRGITATVMPSVCDEVAPVAAIEDMAQGRLTIASDGGGLAELVDGVGLKFTPGDAGSLEACMRRVLDDPDLANVLGEKARERARQLFRADRMVSEHASLYRELAG
jgi:glycosyltransferase involved in cell wall biosynthesis